jgi:hypothetical protein
MGQQRQAAHSPARHSPAHRRARRRVTQRKPLRTNANPVYRHDRRFHSGVTTQFAAMAVIEAEGHQWSAATKFHGTTG